MVIHVPQDTDRLTVRLFILKGQTVFEVRVRFANPFAGTFDVGVWLYTLLMEM
jgi:hypothetical protein